MTPPLGSGFTTGSDADHALASSLVSRREPTLVHHGRAGRKTVRALINCLAGATLSQYFLSSFWVVGWTQRLMQRRVLLTWWLRSPVRAGDVSFERFTQLDAATAGQAAWPSWSFGSQTVDAEPFGRWQRWTGAAQANLKLGLQTAFNTWVVTGPGCFLWAAGWYAGWQNSFNKGYENAGYGPATFFVGMFLFSAAMLHVPLALARQASTGDWRRFYDFRVVWTLLCRHWLAGLGLTLLWTGAAALAVLVKTLPQFLAGYGPRLMELSPDAALRIASRFYWLAALVLFPLYAGIRIAAAHVYARALVESFQAGRIGEDSLSENEWQALRRLGLLVPRKQPRRRRWIVRLVAWLATRTGRVAAVAAVLSLWFILSFVNASGEFLAKTDFGRGWWNQPMVHLPWFNYTPRSLREAAKAESRVQPSAEFSNAPR